MVLVKVVFFLVCMVNEETLHFKAIENCGKMIINIWRRVEK